MQPYLLQHFLDQAAESFPDKTAIENGAERITFSALRARSRAFGDRLLELSPESGERVGIFLDKSVEQIIALLGTLYAGKIFVLINAALQRRQVAYIVNDCGITTLVTSNHLRSMIVDPVLAGTSVTHVLEEADLRCTADETEKGGPSDRCITDDVASIIYTSGSTGVPKGVVVTHRNLVDTARNSTTHLEVSKDERILCPVALNFDYGLNQLGSTLCKGCTLVLYKYLLPSALLRTLAERKITGLPALPPIWAQVFNPRLARIEEGSYDFSSLRYIANTGAKLPVPIVRKIRETFPKARLYLMYGLTEAFRSTYLDPDEVDRRPDSIGKALPNVEIEIVNERNERCKPGEIGELVHRGAGITRGYWNSPELTAKVFRQNPLLAGKFYTDTVVYSGDLARRDEDGFIYYVGRKDHQIKTCGYRVSPTEVESLIMECPGVSEVVVYGTDDPELGAKLCAVVSLCGDTSPEQILEHCRTEAPYYLVPKEFIVVDEFPRTASGKVDRNLIIQNSIAENRRISCQ